MTSLTSLIRQVASLSGGGIGKAMRGALRHADVVNLVKNIVATAEAFVRTRSGAVCAIGMTRLTTVIDVRVGVGRALRNTRGLVLKGQAARAALIRVGATTRAVAERMTTVTRENRDVRDPLQQILVGSATRGAKVVTGVCLTGGALQGQAAGL